jgi:Zn-dependent peptidase ImmA (M78 family)/transcriptional regulator with XRE-family HTH domain
VSAGADHEGLAAAALLFAGERLTLARQLAGLRKSDLARRLDKSPTAVAGWESGVKRPAPATIAQLALALSVDPGFFAVRGDAAHSRPTPHFRSLRSTSQLARDQASAYGQITAAIAAAVERHVELPEVDIPSATVDVDDHDSDAPEQAARMVRQHWSMPTGPVRHVVRRLENSGVLIVFSPPAAASVDAYSFDGGPRPVVVLNPLKDDYYRQRFDAAHELGHLVMHADSEPGGRTVEAQAHRFAAEFLLPARDVADLLPTSMAGSGWRDLQQLKEQWGVSLQALLFRARQLGKLPEVSYRNAMARLSSLGWRRSEPGLVRTVEQPSLLPAAVQLFTDHGGDQAALLDECRVPQPLFDAVIARRPAHGSARSGGSATAPGQVVSLLTVPDRTSPS